MHGEEIQYVQEAYDTNWMSTVGKNINEVEKIAAEKAEMKYAVGLSCCTAALHLCCKLAGERLYGKPAISHGALEGKRVFCSDMTFDATLNPVVYEGGMCNRRRLPYLSWCDTQSEDEISQFVKEFIDQLAREELLVQ